MNKEEWLASFQNLAQTPREYIMTRAIPTFAAGVAAAILFAFTGRLFLPTMLAWALPPLILLFAGVGVVMWPMAQVDRKRLAIDESMPFFMTHFGVLSTSNIPRIEMIEMLSAREGYGDLAKELARVVSLVRDWNMALPEACRFLSKTTPSHIFADFLERLAHAMETGQDLEHFLASEQDVVMKEYATLYETALYQIESWKDLYVSVIMSGAFFVLFAIITPILTGNSPEGLMMGVLAFILFMEVLLLLVLRMRLPSDRLIHTLNIETAERKKVKRAVLVAVVASAILTPIALFLPVPTGVGLASGILPMAYPGFVARRAEQSVQRREDNYGAFIRSVGASLQSRGGSPRDVLKVVKHHNFGPLTATVHNLYARLTWRIDDRRAWKYFSAEAGSHVVDSFTDMFVEGLRTGGKPGRIGDIISENVVRVLNLRRSRYSTAGTFRGILIGLTASMAFVMSAGTGILGVLADLFATVTPETQSSELTPVSLNFSADLELIGAMVLILLMAHSLLGTIMLKMVDGGGAAAGLGTFVLMTWLSAGLLWLSGRMLPGIFNFTAA